MTVNNTIPDISYHTKNRIVAVDLVRILAAFCVMYEHLFPPDDTHMMAMRMVRALPIGVFGHMSGIFFILAGFFACRNITWKKALNNTWWCLAPFLLWNTICVAIAYYADPASISQRSLLSLYGATSFILPQWTLTGELPSDPVNYPLWFMRDLVLLFLLSPILYKTAKYIFPVFLFLSLTPLCEVFFRNEHYVLLSPYSMCLFMFGCLLSQLDKDLKLKVLKYSNPYIIAAYVCVMALTLFISTIYYHDTSDSDSKPLIVSLMGACILYQIARFLELRSSMIAKLALKFAPVTFLTFAAHIIIYNFLVPKAFMNSEIFYMLLPLLVFTIMSLFFFSLKRWARPLLHLVAHYKLRPDDFATAPRRN